MKQGIIYGVFMLLIAVFCNTVFYNIGKNECNSESVTIETQPFDNDSVVIYTMLYDPETGYTTRGSKTEVEYHEEWVRINDETYIGGWNRNVFDFKDGLTGGFITVNNESMTLLFGKVDKPEYKIVYLK